MTRVHSIRTTTASFPSTVHHCHLERASYCHLERPQGVERSKSCKYNKYPEPSSTKTALFVDGRLIFPFPSTKTTYFTDGSLFLVCWLYKLRHFIFRIAVPRAPKFQVLWLFPPVSFPQQSSISPTRCGCDGKSFCRLHHGYLCGGTESGSRYRTR